MTISLLLTESDEAASPIKKKAVAICRAFHSAAARILKRIELVPSEAIRVL